MAVLYESEDTSVSKRAVDILRRAASITKIEFPTVLNILKEQRLIEETRTGGIAAIGLTTSSILGYTGDIFDNQSPSVVQQAAIFIAEKASEKPQESVALAEEVSDSFKLTAQQAADTIDINEQIGFVDAEKLDKKNKLLFNGNLFKFDNSQKVKSILDSLSSADHRKVGELQALIQASGCITIEEATAIAGVSLFQKLNAIGMFDLNLVSNPGEAIKYITNPASFAKFAPASKAGDTFDMAKALVSSLKYGMTRRDSGRGRINDLDALLGALINGRRIGPTTSIGQDYRVLESKRVVKLEPDSIHPDRYWMRLLKKDVGRLALSVLLSGDATAGAAATLTSASITGYVGPEENRVVNRNRLKDNGDDLIDLLRTI